MYYLNSQYNAVCEQCCIWVLGVSQRQFLVEVNSLLQLVNSSIFLPDVLSCTWLWKVVIRQNIYLPYPWVLRAQNHNPKMRKTSGFKSQSRGVRIDWWNCVNRWAASNSFQKLPRFLSCWFRAYRLTKVVYPSKCVASFFLLYLSPHCHFGSKDCSRGDHRYSRDPERERTSSNNTIFLYVII